MRIIALVLVLCGSTSAFAAAEDYGSSVDVRDVRWAAQHLLRHTADLLHTDPDEITITDVVTTPGEAVFSWSIGPARGDWGMRRIERDWWQRFSVSRGPIDVTVVQPPLNTARSTASFNDPTSAALAAAGFSPALVHAAHAHNADVRSADAAAASAHTPFDPLTPSPTLLASVPCCASGYDAPVAAFESGIPVPELATQGFLTTLHLAANDATRDARLVHFLGRAPTRSESPAVLGGNGTYFWSFTLQSKAVVAVRAGTTLDVWAPHVLDPALAYTLTIGHTIPYIGTVKATLRDNVMHFVLPAFALVPGAEAMGEIDGDPTHR